MTYLFFILSAMFGALVQLIVFSQWEEQSWLPGWVFTWDLRLLSTLDAYHTYQGLWLVLFGIAFYLFRNDWLFYKLTFWLSGKFERGRGLRRLLIVAGIVILYYQVYNVFYHIVFRFPEYWRWPIG